MWQGVLSWSPFEKFNQRFFDSFGETAGRFAFLLQGTEFHQADGGGKLGLVQGGFKAADRIGPSEIGRDLENIFRQLLNPGDARAAAANKNPGAQAFEQT